MDDSQRNMSLRKVDEDGPNQEVGSYENIRIKVGYSQRMQAYYVKLSDLADPDGSVFVVDRSEAGYLTLVHPNDFLSALHTALNDKGVYVDGNEQELAAVVSNLALQLLEKKRNEPA
jgi:hypothetical protein